MLINKKYNLSERIIWLIAGICILPVLLSIFGINFGFVNKHLDIETIQRLIHFENESGVQDVLRGRFIHTITVSFSIAIAFLTIILAFIDFRIKGEVSTPIVGVALFCSGLFYTFHILVSTNLVNTENQQFYLTSFTWFFCRLFHASILILGVGIFLFQPKSLQHEFVRNSRRIVFYITVTFVLLTCITITVLFLDTNTRLIGFPYRNIARSYDLIPLALFLFSAFYILPKFYEKYPSVFSQTLLLSMIPAIATQFYMAFGSEDLFDSNFNVSHFMAGFAYFIPFIGLSLNYLQTHKNEKRVILKLNQEAQERKSVEETLSGVLNSSLNSIMSFKSVRDTHNRIVDFQCTLVNPATQLLFGLTHGLKPGKKLLEQISSVKNEGWMEMFKHVVETGEPLNHEYYSDHYRKWFLMIGVKLEDGLAVTISDISKRKDAVQELMAAEKLAVTGRIARTIAHEVRNPLTNINLSIEHLKGDSSNTEKELYHDIIRRNSERINQLITELLNSSKQTELKPGRIPVNQVLDETLELALDRLQLKGIRLEKNYSVENIEINVDAAKFKTALLNLIINAIEAMQEEKGILKISSMVINKKCIIRIEDNGDGIKPEEMERLFEPFFSNKKKGMGLGLAATQNIILAHKGTIDVDSKPGKGTVFTIGMPLA